MDSRVEKEACYLIDEIERTLDRIHNYNDFTEEEFKSIKDMAIVMLQEWSQLDEQVNQDLGGRMP